MNNSSDVSTNSGGEPVTKDRSIGKKTSKRVRIVLASSESSTPRISDSHRRPYVPRDEHDSNTSKDTASPKADPKTRKECRKLTNNGDEMRLHEPGVEQVVDASQSEIFRKYFHKSTNEIQRCHVSLQKSLNKKPLNAVYLKYLENSKEALSKSIENFEKWKTDVKPQLSDEECDSSKTFKVKLLQRFSKIFYKQQEKKSINKS